MALLGMDTRHCNKPLDSMLARLRSESARQCTSQELAAIALIKPFGMTRCSCPPDQNQKQEYTSTYGGVVFSTWIGGATGRGADHFVIDDPHALNEAHSPLELGNTVNYVRRTIFSPLDRPAKGSIVLIMQRLHENDLTSELLNPSRDADTERLDLAKEVRRSKPAPDFSMFTRNLRVY